MTTITPFEYAVVLVSIVLGLGIARLLAGVADLIQHAASIRWYAPYLAWIPLLFFLQIQAWWLFYGLREKTVWHLPVFLFAIVYPIGLYILARLLFPDLRGGGMFSQRDFYYRQYRKIFLVVATLAAVTLAENALLYRRPVAESIFPALLMAAMLGIALFRLRHEWLHRALAIALLAVMIGATAVNWGAWSLTP